MAAPGREPVRPEPSAGQSHGQIPRAWLYILALVLLGVLVVPFVWRHRGISTRERAFIIFLGLLQTVASVVVAVFFVRWMFGWMRGQLDMVS